MRSWFYKTFNVIAMVLILFLSVFSTETLNVSALSNIIANPDDSRSSEAQWQDLTSRWFNSLQETITVPITSSYLFESDGATAYEPTYSISVAVGGNRMDSESITTDSKTFSVTLNYTITISDSSGRVRGSRSRTDVVNVDLNRNIIKVISNGVVIAQQSISMTAPTTQKIYFEAHVDEQLLPYNNSGCAFEGGSGAINYCGDSSIVGGIFSSISSIGLTLTNALYGVTKNTVMSAGLTRWIRIGTANYNETTEYVQVMFKYSESGWDKSKYPNQLFKTLASYAYKSYSTVSKTISTFLGTRDKYTITPYLGIEYGTWTTNALSLPFYVIDGASTGDYEYTSNNQYLFEKWSAWSNHIDGSKPNDTSTTLYTSSTRTDAGGSADWIYGTPTGGMGTSVVSVEARTRSYSFSPEHLMVTRRTRSKTNRTVFDVTVRIRSYYYSYTRPKTFTGADAEICGTTAKSCTYVSGTAPATCTNGSICGVTTNYAYGSHSSCGISYYKSCATSACGNNYCATSACGCKTPGPYGSCLAYKSCYASACGYKTCQNSACGVGGYLTCNYVTGTSPRTCTSWSCGSVNTYTTGVNASACGVTINTCTWVSGSESTVSTSSSLSGWTRSNNDYWGAWSGWSNYGTAISSVPANTSSTEYSSYMYTLTDYGAWSGYSDYEELVAGNVSIPSNTDTSEYSTRTIPASEYYGAWSGWSASSSGTQTNTKEYRYKLGWTNTYTGYKYKTLLDKLWSSSYALIDDGYSLLDTRTVYNYRTRTERWGSPYVSYDWNDIGTGDLYSFVKEDIYQDVLATYYLPANDSLSTVSGITEGAVRNYGTNIGEALRGYFTSLYAPKTDGKVLQDSWLDVLFEYNFKIPVGLSDFLNANIFGTYVYVSDHYRAESGLAPVSKAVAGVSDSSDSISYTEDPDTVDYCRADLNDDGMWLNPAVAVTCCGLKNSDGTQMFAQYNGVNMCSTVTTAVSLADIEFTRALYRETFESSCASDTKASIDKFIASLSSYSGQTEGLDSIIKFVNDKYTEFNLSSFNQNGFCTAVDQFINIYQ